MGKGISSASSSQAAYRQPRTFGHLELSALYALSGIAQLRETLAPLPRTPSHHFAVTHSASMSPMMEEEEEEYRRKSPRCSAKHTLRFRSDCRGSNVDIRTPVDDGHVPNYTT